MAYIELVGREMVAEVDEDVDEDVEAETVEAER
jgi:hypothetical protein